MQDLQVIFEGGDSRRGNAPRHNPHETFPIEITGTLHGVKGIRT